MTAMTAADFLRFGSLGLAALILLGTLAMYQQELWKTHIDKAKMRSLLYFMGFALLLLLVSAALEIVKLNSDRDLAKQIEVDKTQLALAQQALDKKNQKIREALNRSLGAFEVIESAKLNSVVNGVNDPNVRSNLLGLLAEFCSTVTDLNAVVAGKDTDPNEAKKCDDIKRL
jgi:hypothetical protein